MSGPVLVSGDCTANMLCVYNSQTWTARVRTTQEIKVDEKAATGADTRVGQGDQVGHDPPPLSVPDLCSIQYS